MTVDTDFVPGALRGKFVDHASQLIGEQRWEDARGRHGLLPGSEVPDHPMNMSRAHYARRKRIRSLARPHQDPEYSLTVEECRWYPVGGCTFESYGDLRYRIRMLFALPSMSPFGSFEDAVRSLRNKRTVDARRRRMVTFRAVDEGTRIERYLTAGGSSQPDITYKVLGFELVQDSGTSLDSLWCPEGLGQARRILGEINGSSELVAPGLVEEGGGLINDREFLHLAGKEFDSGDRSAPARGFDP